MIYMKRKWAEENVRTIVNFCNSCSTNTAAYFYIVYCRTCRNKEWSTKCDLLCCWDYSLVQKSWRDIYGPLWTLSNELRSGTIS